MLKGWIFYFFSVFLLFKATDLTGMVQLDSIKVGEKVPNISFFARMADSIFRSSIDKYKGTLLILDFWNKGCGSCIASFPDLERLNNQNKGKAIILPVTRDSYQALHDLREKSQIMKESKMVQILEDSILHNLFPHKFVPHYAWIDRGGRFIGTSAKVDSGAVSEVLLTGKLSANVSNLRQSDEPIVCAKLDSVTLAIQRKKTGRSYYSDIEKIIAPDFNKFAKRTYPVWADSTRKRVIGYRYYGYYLIDLIKLAYGISQNGDISLSDNSLSYLFPPKEREDLEEWQADKLYTYTFWSDSMSAFDINSKKLIMRKDLEERFGVIGSFKEVEKPCYVLDKKETGEASYFYKKNEGMQHAEHGRSEITLNGIYARNVEMHIFLRSLYHFVNKFNRFELSIINETGYGTDHLVNMYIRVKNRKCLNSLDEALSSVGLTIRREKRKSVFFVLNRRKSMEQL